MSTQNDKLYASFMTIRRNILAGDDSRAFQVLKNIVKLNMTTKKRKTASE